MSAPFESAIHWLEDPSLGLVKTARPPQIEMAKGFEIILRDPGMAGIEGGTGVGKSYAYLVAAAAAGLRIVISTGRKTLQTQLYERDIPHVLKFVNPNLKYALLKGKANYACPLRFSEFLKGSEASKFNDRSVDDFEEWLKTHPTGDLEAYPETIYFGQHVRITECVRAQCPKAFDCGYIRNKVHAASAPILVVNHALLAYDLFLGGGKILGEYDVLVIDEAHQAPKFFREAYSLSMFPRQPDILEKLLSQDMSITMPSSIKDLYQHVFSNVHTEPGPFRLTPRLEDALKTLQTEWRGLKDQFVTKNLMPVQEGLGPEDFVPEESIGMSARDTAVASHKAKLTSAAGFVLGQIDLCSILLGQPPQEMGMNASETEFLSFVDVRGEDNNHIELKTTPLHIGPLVAPGLLHIGRVLLTSATLTSSKNNWSYLVREFGLSEEQLKVKMVLDSPFNYKTNSAMYLSTTAPEWETVGRPDPDRYYSLMAKEIHALLSASKGGAFIICPSKKEMERYYELLGDMSGPYNIMKQSSNVDKDLEEYQGGFNNVLIGVQSIGEGVDLPGNILRLVIIPRLPFTPPTDVVLQTQMQRLKDSVLDGGGSPMEANMKAFNTYSLPEMLFKLKQWVGRLIRTADDRGVVAILDTRIIKKKYGKMVQGSFPHPIYYDRDKIMKFLNVISV